MSNADKIRRMLAEGKTAKEISKKLGVPNSYVHTIKWQDKKNSKIIRAVFDATRDIRKAPDNVNKPPHYTAGGIDFLDYAEAKGLTENAYLFNVVKYVSRAGKKVGSDPIEDLKKAEFYLKREIAVRERA